jgi:hypothetical protein
LTEFKNPDETRVEQFFKEAENAGTPAHRGGEKITAELGGEQSPWHPRPLAQSETQSEERYGHAERRGESGQGDRLAHGKSKDDEQKCIHAALELLDQATQSEFGMLFTLGQTEQLLGQPLRFLACVVRFHCFTSPILG